MHGTTLSGKAGHINLTIEQGSHYDLRLVWSDSAGTLHDLTGFTGEMIIRPTLDSDMLYARLTTADGQIVLGPGTGEVHVVMSATQTRALQWREGVYQLLMTHPSGEVTRLLEGKVVLVRSLLREEGA